MEIRLNTEVRFFGAFPHFVAFLILIVLVVILASCPDIQAFMEEVDTNMDGFVSWAEYYDALLSQQVDFEL